jgi:predicted DNA-binding WGR domain protein
MNDLNNKKDYFYWQKIMPNNAIRYYSAHITRDLFDVIVFCTWGTIGSKRGGTKTHPVETSLEATKLMDSIFIRREQRGYLLENETEEIKDE